MNRTCISRWNILYFLAITLTGLPAATSIDIWGKQNARSSKNLWPPAVLSTPLRQNPPDSVLRSSTDDWNANERHGNRIESDDVTAKHKNYNNHNGEEEEHCFFVSFSSNLPWRWVEFEISGDSASQARPISFSTHFIHGCDLRCPQPCRRICICIGASVSLSRCVGNFQFL